MASMGQGLNSASGDTDAVAGDGGGATPPVVPEAPVPPDDPAAAPEGDEGNEV